MAERTVHFVPDITAPRRRISYQPRRHVRASGPDFASLVSGFVFWRHQAAMRI
jgi:hypothetical protein